MKKVQHLLYFFLAFELLAVFNAGAHANADDQTERLPVEAFARLPTLTDLALSPSGRQIAYIANVPGGALFVIRDLETNQDSGITKSDNTKYIFRWVEWLSEEHLVVSVMYPDRRGAVATGETRLMLVNAKKKKLKPVIKQDSLYRRGQHFSQFHDRIISFLPNQPNEFLLALDLEQPTYPGVYKINAENGQRSTVQRSRKPIRSWIADRQGRVRAGAGFDADKSLRSAWVRDIEDDSLKKMWEYKVFEAPSIKILGFGLDPNKLYISAQHQGRRAIFSIDTNSQDYTRTLVVSDPDYDIDGALIYSPKTNDVVGVSHANARSGVLYFDDEYSQFQQSVDKALPTTSNTIFDFSADEISYLVSSSNASDPRTYLAGNRLKGTLSPFAHDYPLLEGQPLSTKKRAVYTARDGKKIEAFLSLPPEGSAKNLPTILFPHGGPMSRSHGGFDYWTQFFTHRGYAVLQPNFRGSAGQGHEFQMEALQAYGLSMQDDLEDGARWLIQQGTTDRKRMCIVGASYGGYAALMGAIKTPELFSCAISFAGISNLLDIRARARHFVNKNIVREQIGKETKVLKQTSPELLANAIKIPVLLAHGKSDRIVPVEQSRSMAKALKKAKVPHIYLELDEGSHYLSLEKNRIAFFTAMEKFLAQHLPVN